MSRMPESSIRGGGRFGSAVEPEFFDANPFRTREIPVKRKRIRGRIPEITVSGSSSPGREKQTTTSVKIKINGTPVRVGGLVEPREPMADRAQALVAAATAPFVDKLRGMTPLDVDTAVGAIFAVCAVVLQIGLFVLARAITKALAAGTKMTTQQARSLARHQLRMAEALWLSKSIRQ